MRRLPLWFLLGFVLAYAPSIFIFSKTSSKSHEVLAQDADKEAILVVLETNAPKETSVVLAAADEEVTATPEPTQSPTPTQSATPTQTPTPTPEPTQTPIPEPTPTPDVWSPGDLEGWFSQYAGQYGVDKNVLERLANCESHFNPNARNGDYLGMFQFSTGTWQTHRSKMGLDANPDLRSNSEESIKTAAYVIQQRGTTPWPSCLN